jgi:hypothetical protein
MSSGSRPSVGCQRQDPADESAGPKLLSWPRHHPGTAPAKELGVAMELATEVLFARRRGDAMSRNEEDPGNGLVEGLSR